MNAHRMRRGAALSAAVALGFGGAVAAAPDASAVEAKASAKLAQVATDDTNVQGFAQGDDGKPVIVTVADPKAQGAPAKNGEASLDTETKQAVKDAKAEVITLAKPLSARADNPQSVIGAGGYIASPTTNPTAGGGVGLCSIGFSALSTSFAPQAISAGHCTAGKADKKGNYTTGKNMNVFASLPKADDAANNRKAGKTQPQLLPNGFKGKVAKYQFGDKGQTGPKTISGGGAGNGGNASTDYSIINLDKNAQGVAAVTKWNQANAKKNVLAAGATKVTGVGTAAANSTITRSGRTTGQASGKVIMTKGWMNVDGRKVYGFGATVHSDHGDSGGSFVDSKGNAVGVLSGGGKLTNGKEISWATDLRNALDKAGTGTRVNVAKKAAAKAQTVAPKGEVKGTGAKGFTGGTFIASDGKKTSVKVSGDKWSFKGADAEQQYKGKLYLTSKYAVSQPADVAYTVKQTAAPAPSPSDSPKPTSSTSTSAAPNPGGTGSPSAQPSATSATPEPSDTGSATPSPSQSTTDKPSTQAPAPKPAQAKLAVNPQRISLDKFVGDGAKDKGVGVSIYATGAKPGSTVTITTSKDGIEAKKETATADKDGNVSTRVWGLPSASDTSVYLGTYKVTANMQPASGARASGTASKTLTSSFDVVKGDAGNGGGQDNGNPGDDQDNGNSNDNGSSDPDQNDNGDLPGRGANVGGALATAAGLMALGAGIVLTVRRRGQQ